MKTRNIMPWWEGAVAAGMQEIFLQILSAGYQFAQVIPGEGWNYFRR
jgi:hypothetical protein